MIELRAYDPAWAIEFEREATLVCAAVGDCISAIEHIGSTAVPGLIAKPIIDLAARAASGSDPFGLEAPLAELGYLTHKTGPKNHAVYVRLRDGRRTHILHVFTADQWTHCNQRVFRDKLMHDPSARRRYQELKQSIVLMDGREYTAAKRALIEELLNQERADRGLPRTVAWDK